MHSEILANDSYFYKPRAIRSSLEHYITTAIASCIQIENHPEYDIV